MYSKKETVKVLLSDLNPHPKNPKKHDDALIEKSISELGYAENIVIDENNVIIAGHGRVDALKKTTKSESFEIDAIRITGWTEEEKEKYLLLSNQSTMLGGFDDVLLKEFESEVLDFAGLDSDILIEHEDKDDAIPEESPTRAKLGDLWSLGRHRVVVGDATKIEDVERLMDGRKADLYLTDPPYNVNYEGTGGKKILNDNKGDGDFRAFLRDSFSSADAFLKEGGVFYIWHSDSEGYNFRSACKDVSWIVRQCLIWNKSQLVMGRQDYQWKHEPCLYGWKEGAGHLWASDRKQTTVINIDKPTNSKEHPTMKPVELFAYQIMNNTKGEDIVLDTFLGSGTSVIACEKTGRTCYGMELDPKYVDVIIKRYEDFSGNKAQKI